MKRNRAELGTMSVSALDLFASALGVFIILTSVSLPFIFNTSQSTTKNLSQAQLEAEVKSSSNPEEALNRLIKDIIALRAEIEELKKTSKEITEHESATDLTSKIESLEQALKNAEKSLEAALKEQNTTELIPPIDIIIALDTTGSMTGQLRSFQGGVIYLSRILMKWSESPAVGIIEIMDQCDYYRRKKFSLREINSTSLSDLQRFVYSMGKMNTGCNNDMEEGIHLALREALTSNWRPNVDKKVIILMSDFPPYKHMISEVQRSIKGFSNKDNQTVSIVHPLNASSTQQHVSVMKNLARLGKGQYIDGAGSIIGAIILAL
jgi:hypothetical protein